MHSACVPMKHAWKSAANLCNKVSCLPGCEGNGKQKLIQAEASVADAWRMSQCGMQGMQAQQLVKPSLTFCTRTAAPSEQGC